MKCCLVPLTSCDLCTCKIYSCYFQNFTRRFVYKTIHCLSFDLDHGGKITQNVTQYPLHYVIYASTKFGVAKFNGLGEDTIKRNVMDRQTEGWTDAQTDGRRTNFGTKLIYLFFNEKAGIIMINLTKRLSMARKCHSHRSRIRIHYMKRRIQLKKVHVTSSPCPSEMIAKLKRTYKTPCMPNGISHCYQLD